MKKLIVLAIIALGAGFSACQKEKEIFPTSQSEMIATPPSLVDDSTHHSDSLNEPKISSWTILHASNANQIPSKFFRVKSKYKNSYVHKHQPDNTSCSWTNYVLCTGAIANANGNSYPVTNNQIYLVKSRCNNSISISALANYAGYYDNSIISYSLKCSYDDSNGRFEMVKYMLSHINTHHTPFVALALDAQSGKGHYLTVWSINWKVGGTGSTVYYTNSLTYPPSSNPDFDDVVKHVSLTTFLNWMRDNPQAEKYNCLFLWSK
ncbi:MAG: hypothetical protein CO170_03000 [candidate division SR1 bacterium CG_4_9_14_3_um_filter_40_9]|nr:MAG: hypothetical protein CO170_03000 [candidate division SR1 bacterium CG_4_9_14_3_um_filter_40_9]